MRIQSEGAYSQPLHFGVSLARGFHMSTEEYLSAAAAFVRIRDLLHCEKLWEDVEFTRSELRRQWLGWLSDTKPLADRPGCPDWLALAHAYEKGRDREDWHLACQGVDRYISLESQGRQARQLGIPINVGIHDKLDDGTDTLGPWKEGWKEQDKKGGNPPVFSEKKVVSCDP